MAEVKAESTGKTYTVTVTHTNTRWQRLKLWYNDLRMDKPFVKLWSYRMWLHATFFAQGFFGFATLTLWQPSWTVKPSQYLALQRHRCQEIRDDEAARKQAEEKGEEYKSDLVIPTSEEEEIAQFAKRFAAKKKYDSRGHLIKEEKSEE